MNVDFTAPYSTATPIPVDLDATAPPIDTYDYWDAGKIAEDVVEVPIKRGGKKGSKKKRKAQRKARRQH